MESGSKTNVDRASPLLGVELLVVMVSDARKYGYQKIYSARQFSSARVKVNCGGFSVKYRNCGTIIYRRHSELNLSNNSNCR
jgi:hypothetical protein